MRRTFFVVYTSGIYGDDTRFDSLWSTRKRADTRVARLRARQAHPKLDIPFVQWLKLDTLPQGDKQAERDALGKD